MVSRRRPRWWSVAAFATAMCVATSSASTIPASARSHVTDSHGLVFTSTQSFCALHCRPWRRDRAVSQCTSTQCPEYHSATRHLATATGSSSGGAVDDPAATSKLTVLSCTHHHSPSHEKTTSNGEYGTPSSYVVDAADATLAATFRGFHDAFFQAFDAMITSENASVDACRLQSLQDDFLETGNDDDDQTKSDHNATTSAGTKPMLVRFAGEDEKSVDHRVCASAVRAATVDPNDTSTDRMTPFLSRADQSRASATVMLVHVDATRARSLAGLDCVASIVELPAILKLLPFARSAVQLGLPNETARTPMMWIRVLHGRDPPSVFTRLQAKFTRLYGVQNVFQLPERPDLFPRGVFIPPLDHLELWTHAVLLAAQDEDVEWIDAKHDVTLHTQVDPHYVRLSSQMRRRLDAYDQSLIGVRPAQQRGINGSGIIVGITDSGLYIDHDQFDQPSRAIYSSSKPDMNARKVVLYNPWADAYDQSETITCGHGTHVSGLLAGSSLSGKIANLGIAAGARIAFMDIGAQSSSCAGTQNCGVSLATPADSSMLLQSQINVGARIFSFSWGTPGSDYSSQARDLDDFVYENPNILIIVAAGNSGEASTNGQGTISSPSGAKNVISVGASLNAAASFTDYGCPSVFNPDSIASFSSAGPTTDGRLKPDVVAPGMSLVSSESLAPGMTSKTSTTCSLQGTSQATPIVTGIAVLLYQWLSEGWWKNGVKDSQFAMKTIPAALLKALIIHSGDSLQRRLAPITTTITSCAALQRSAWSVSYPDVYQGYGRPNMSNIADFTASPGATPTLYFLPNSTTGSEPAVANGKRVLISFTVPRGVDLRATLVWTDPAGSIRATTQLQHDLDLTVQIRNTSKVFYPLTADKTTNRDEKNNVEMVQVSYKQLVDAVTAENASSLIGANGEIIVDAIIYARSVLLSDVQKFAFVASSSVIGTTSGSSPSGASGSSSSSILSSSFWTPWMIGGVVVGALVLLMLVAACVSCCSRKTRRPPGAARPRSSRPVRGGGYYVHSTPAAASRNGLETCPYCAFASPDAVVMVNHVETMHTSTNNQPHSGTTMSQSTNPTVPPTVDAAPAQFILPSYPMYDAQQHVAAPVGYSRWIQNGPSSSDENRCPYCSFLSTDPVILVNHVEHMHGNQRFV